jgi:hypothetical protein
MGISLGEICLNRSTAKCIRMYKERTAVGDGCNAEIARWHGDKVTRGPFVPWRV